MGGEADDPPVAGPIDVTFGVIGVLVVAEAVVAAVAILTHWIPSPSGAAGLAAAVFVAFPLVFSFMGLFRRGRRFKVDLDREDLRCLLSPVLPFGALIVGLLFGYLFW